MDICPLCDADLRGEPIDPKYAHMYATTHYSRMIGVEVRWVYDGVLYWCCPDCGGAWPRFTGRSPRADVSAAYAARHGVNA